MEYLKEYKPELDVNDVISAEFTKHKLFDKYFIFKVIYNQDGKKYISTTKIAKSKKVARIIEREIYFDKNKFGKALYENNSNITNICNEINMEVTKDKKKKEKEIIPPILIKKTGAYKPPDKSKTPAYIPNSSGGEENKRKAYAPPSSNREDGCKFRKRPQVKISNLSEDVTVEDIIELCSQYGRVGRCNLPISKYGKNKGKMSGIAYVQFSISNEVNRCIKALNGTRLGYMVINVEAR
tara:strand:- start:1055 stop:1771 length:717 start_codon:yes stop_codon:yes gene_type:complete